MNSTKTTNEFKQCYDFDKITDRRNTSCLKYDFGKARMGREDLLPMWVADMDFPLPPEVLSCLRERVDHGIFGYTDPDDVYYDILERWFRHRYGWEIRREWNTVTPGVVYALATAVRALTEPGDAVLIQEPVYYPFREVIEDNHRVCVSSPLIRRMEGQESRYVMDLADFEEKIRQNHVKLFLLCSPHNPVGRVWSRDELERVSEICLRYQVRVVVDEIHCDFIFSGHHFTPYGTLEESYVENAVICTSPSKSFNMAGLQTANILIPNEQLRLAFKKENAAAGYSQGNVMGITAVKAVYEKGEEWLDALLVYLEENLNFFRQYLKENIPGARLIEPEGTYLLWVDFSGVVDNYGELHTLLVDKAHLWLDEGVIFGGENALFARFNIACPRSILEQGLSQLAKAVQQNK